MRLLLLIAIILGSCQTPKLDKGLEQQVLRLNYFIDHDRCFITYNKCLHLSWDKGLCWEKHEACVVHTHKKYKELMD